MTACSKYIYADNAATTKLDPAAYEAMLPFLTEEYGNPSSLYSVSRRAREALSEARFIIAECIGALPDEIYFTSGGSESDNWAIKGICEAQFPVPKHKHIITSVIEHHAILNTCRNLERLGYQVSYLVPSKCGQISPVELAKALMPETAIVSIMHANNEIGTIDDIRALASITHSAGVPFHTDAVQSVGHIPIDVKDLQVDLLSASGHKFNGPKGIGFLYVRKGTALANLIDGGQQESGHRAGTENVASAVGMAVALLNNCRLLPKNTVKLRKMEQEFRSLILEKIPLVVFNGDGAKHLPGHISLSLPDISGEALMHILDLKGIALSIGAACNSQTTKISHVLQGIGLADDLAKGTIRISFGYSNQPADAIEVANAIISYHAKLR